MSSSRAARLASFIPSVDTENLNTMPMAANIQIQTSMASRPHQSRSAITIQGVKDPEIIQ